jgi:hypothetical protein
MANARELAERARMFEERAEKGDRSDIAATLPRNGCPLSIVVSRTSGRGRPSHRGIDNELAPCSAIFCSRKCIRALRTRVGSPLGGLLGLI